MLPDEFSNRAKVTLRRFDKDTDMFSNSDTGMISDVSSKELTQVKLSSEALIKHAIELTKHIEEYNSKLDAIQKEENECRGLMDRAKTDAGITDEAILQELEYLKQVSSNFVNSV